MRPIGECFPEKNFYDHIFPNDLRKIWFNLPENRMCCWFHLFLTTDSEITYSRAFSRLLLAASTTIFKLKLRSCEWQWVLGMIIWNWILTQCPRSKWIKFCNCRFWSSEFFWYDGGIIKCATGSLNAMFREWENGNLYAYCDKCDLFPYLYCIEHVVE